MDDTTHRRNTGLRKQIRHGKRLFRIPENTDHYSAEQYKVAEKKFITRCILEDRCAL